MLFFSEQRKVNFSVLINTKWSGIIIIIKKKNYYVVAAAVVAFETKRLIFINCMQGKLIKLIDWIVFNLK